MDGNGRRRPSWGSRQRLGCLAPCPWTAPTRTCEAVTCLGRVNLYPEVAQNRGGIRAGSPNRPVGMARCWSALPGVAERSVAVPDRSDGC